MFKLHIECSKDIDELHINFSDGTTSMISKENNDEPERELPADNVHVNNNESKSNDGSSSSKDVSKTPRKNLTEYIDLDEDTERSEPKSLKLPEIPKVDRSVPLVTDELKNGKF